MLCAQPTSFIISLPSGYCAENGMVLLSLDKNQEDILRYGERQLKIYPDDPNRTIDMFKECGFGHIEKHEVEFAHLIKAKRR